MGNQLVFDEPSNESKVQHLVLFVPAICALVSVISLLVQKYLYDLDIRKTLFARSLSNASVVPAPTRLTSSGFPLAEPRRAKNSYQENRTTFWKILRLVSCLVLVTLSIVAIAIAEPCPKTKPEKPGKQDDSDYGIAKHGWGKHRNHKKRHPVELCFTQEQLTQLSLGAFYTYAGLLALLAIALQSKFLDICNSHLEILLIITLTANALVTVLLYIPLSDDPSPNEAPDWLSWMRIIVLVFAAVVVPTYIRRFCVPPKPKPIPVNWPTSGRLVVKNLSAKYSAGGRTILRDISFEIKGGERIGVVGGTGCGKSALVLALLRKIPAQGEIHYDGILTSIIDPDLLRNSIGIISRESPITSATIRQNLDPLGLHDDAVLNSALSFAGLDFKKSRSHLRLDTLVTASGGSLPAEHREIIALARATVQRNKLVILDNVTDGIESIVLSNPPTELGGAALLVITDRLRAICDMDKIIVLDEGEIAEFDTPRALIKVEDGVFKLLVDEDRDRDELHAILSSES